MAASKGRKRATHNTPERRNAIRTTAEMVKAAVQTTKTVRDMIHATGGEPGGVNILHYSP